MTSFKWSDGFTQDGKPSICDTSKDVVKIECKNLAFDCVYHCLYQAVGLSSAVVETT